MNCLLNGTILTLFLAQICYAQWFWQNPTPNFETELTRVKVFDNNRVLIVGHEGIIFITTNGGYSWGKINSGLTEDISNVSFINDHYGIIHSYATILLTTDGGWTWEPFPEPPGAHNYLHCFMLDSLNIFIAGSKWGGNFPIGVMFITNDGGLNWTEVAQFGQGNELRKVHFFDSSHGVVTTSDGKIYRSSDGGMNWVETLSTNIGFRQLSFCDSLNGIANGGIIYAQQTFRTSDGGITWEQITNPPDYLDDLIYFNYNFIIGVGSNKSVHKSSDHGTTWVQLLRLGGGISNNFNGVGLADYNNIFVAGSKGDIYKSPDSGQNWYSKRQGVIEDLLRVDFADRNYGMIAGRNGMILKTNNGGAEWNITSSGYIQDFYGIVSIDISTFIIVGESGLIIKTTDGGTSFVQKNSGTSNTLQDIQMLNSNFGLIVGSGILLKTADGGDTWNLQNFPVSAYSFRICILDTQNIVITADGKIYHSIDGGLNWEMVYQNLTESLHSINKLGSHSLFAAGSADNYSTLLLKSTDLGNTWTQISIPYLTDNSSGSSFIDSVNGLLCFYGGEIYRTSTGGNSWTQEFISDAELRDIDMININDATTVGSFGTIVSSITDHIIPVELMYFSGRCDNNKVILKWATATELNNLLFEVERMIISNSDIGRWVTIGSVKGKGTSTEHSEYNFYDIIDGISDCFIDYRLKQVDYNGVYSYSEVFRIYAPVSNYNLFQNYPNPFNPITTINYCIPKSGKLKLTVYDALGREVRILVNEEKPAGRYEIDFDGSELSSGVYFYRIQAENFIQTKKMMLLK